MKFAARFSSWKFILLVLLLPIFVFGSSLLTICIREWYIYREIQAKCAIFRTEGIPYDNTSLDLWYRAQTSPVATPIWLNVIEASKWGPSSTALHELSSMYLKNEAVKGQRQLLEEYLEQMNSTRLQILNLAKFNEPCTMPVQFHGLQTLLPEHSDSTNLQSFLKADFLYSYETGNRNRAFEDLVAMQGVVRAYDIHFCQITLLLQSHNIDSILDCILRSLEISSWNLAELEALQQRVKQTSFHARAWQHAFQGEMSMYLDNDSFSEISITSPFHGLTWIAPSSRSKLVIAFEKVLALCNEPLDNVLNIAHI